MLVAVQLSVLGLYLPPVLKWLPTISAPDDHFTAAPDCRVTASGSGRVGRAGGCPTIRAGIVLPAGVQNRWPHSAPDDHFAAGPDCGVPFVRKARWWCWWLSNCLCWDCIFRRCLNATAPDDHFTAGPHCRVKVSGSGRVGGAGRSPRVISAATRGTGYFRKRVGNLP